MFRRKSFVTVLLILNSIFLISVHGNTESPAILIPRVFTCKEFDIDSTYKDSLCTIENFIEESDLLPAGGDHIKELIFKQSTVKRIPSGLFRIFPKLISVNLSSSSVEIINEHSFDNAINLEKIILDDNQIKEIPADTFKAVSNLKYASFKNNKIQKIDTNAFESAANLEELYLSSNDIENLDSEIFRNTKKLLILNVANNKLKIDSAALFQHAKQLKILDISGNLIENPNIDDFKRVFKHLERIDLASEK
jgi:Leucine-rich repeat (LRR) protein